MKHEPSAGWNFIGSCAGFILCVVVHPHEPEIYLHAQDGLCIGGTRQWGTTDAVFHPFRAAIFAPLSAPDIQPQTWSYLKQLIEDLLLDRHMRCHNANLTTILPVVPFVDLHGMVYFRIVAMRNEYQITHTYSLTRIAIPQSLRIKDTVVF